jgi:hypothetical protein
LVLQNGPQAWGCLLCPHPSLLLQLLLLDLLVVGDDLPDAVDEAALVIGDEAHEDLLLGRVQEHEHAHLAGGRVGEVHTTGKAIAHDAIEAFEGLQVLVGEMELDHP